MARRRKTADEAIEDAGEHLNGADEEERTPAEKKAVIETRIVADLGMKKKHFAAAYKLYQLDQGVRDELQDTIRECFAALGIGMQVNWLDAADQAEGHAGVSRAD